MPSKSKAQHNFMAAIANSPSFAKKAGVPMSVGKEFVTADKGKKFSKGGEMKHEDVKMDKKMMQKAVNKHEGRLHKGSPMTKLASGGMPMVMKDGQKVPAFAADGKGKMAKGGMAKKMNMGGMAYAKGGFTKSADGIATKGKTKAMQVKMRGGGAC
jgi:hypothetical protein